MECAGSAHLREEAHCLKKLSLEEAQGLFSLSFRQAMTVRSVVQIARPAAWSQRLVAHPLVESSRLPPAALPRLEDYILTSTLGPKAPKNDEK